MGYTPNHIRVDTSSNRTSRLVLAEVYSPGWRAYLDGKEEVSVQEKPDTLRLVDIAAGTKFVDFKYEPESYQRGRLITLATIIILAGLFPRSWKRKT